MNTNKSVVVKRRKAFTKTSIKFEKRFKQIFYLPETGSHPFPKQRACEQKRMFSQVPNREPVHRRTKGVRDWEQRGREGRAV